MARLTEFVELTRRDIEAMAGEFGLNDIETIAPLVGGVINTNYHLRTARGDYMLRLYPLDRTVDAVRFELSTLAHLTADGLPVPRPVASPLGDGGGYSRRHQRRFVVFEFIPGRALPRENIDENIATQVGDIFGWMQTRLEGFVPSGCKPAVRLDDIAVLKDRVLSRLHASGATGETLAEKLRSRWQRAYANLAGRELVSGVVHADLYYDNVVVRDGKVVGIIDFDDCYFGLFTMDLAVVLMEFSFVEREHFDFRLAEHLLTAYVKRRPTALLEWDGIGDSMTCACYKYLGYTSELEDYAGEGLFDNEYLTRILHVTDPDFRIELDRLLAKLRKP